MDKRLDKSMLKPVLDNLVSVLNTGELDTSNPSQMASLGKILVELYIINPDFINEKAFDNE